MTKPFMTPGLTRALDWLEDNGGEGTLTRRGQMMAVNGQISLADPLTWLRLVSFGHIEATGPYKFRVRSNG